jgi:phosphoribosylformylglycinamidine (FGAM) synthase-like enzyme
MAPTDFVICVEHSPFRRCFQLQAFGQIGDDCPDIDDISVLKSAFNTVQHLLDEGLLSAGHDVSDGGVVTTLLEMAFSGNCGLQVRNRIVCVVHIGSHHHPRGS